MMRTLSFLLLFLVCMAAPQVTSAQESTGELRATIRGAIMSDPRTAGLSETQINTLVDLLAQEAQKQGVTAQDIQWRPEGTERFVTGESTPPTQCTGGFLCLMSEAFGFIGPDTTIPFTLGAASMGLVWILAEMIHRRRYPSVAPASTPVSGL